VPTYPFKHLPVQSLEDVTYNFEQLGGQILTGTGAPEGRIGAPIGVIYLRSDGSTGSTLYVKERAASPTDPTGWAAK
jgi:hypothetical protein